MNQFHKFSSITEVANEGQKSQRLLYVYKGGVYDLTSFQSHHPGGRGPLMTYKGSDLENLLFNPSLHKHKPGVINTLIKYKCGVLVPQAMNNSKSTDVTASGGRPRSQSNQLQESNLLKNRSKSLKQKETQQKKQNSDRLNQSFTSNRLNQSMTSSQRSQFLMIPSREDVLKVQKEKQKQFMQKWQDSEIAEYKRQQSVVLGEKEQRKTQSEILSTPKSSINPYYQQWLARKSDRAQSLEIQQTQSVILPQAAKKSSNQYYEQWKKQQEQKRQQERQLEQSVILEENESQISPAPSSVNNSFQRSFSQRSIRSVVQEDANLQVPHFEPKLISPLKCKFTKIMK